MDWGLLQGLGGGLQEAGKIWTEKAKADLVEKLAREREDRAKQRDIDKENRAIENEKITPVGNRAVTDESGNVWMQPINKAGDPVGERRPADAAERQQHKNQTETTRLSMEKLIADIGKAKFEVGRLQTEAELDDALANARINTEKAQAGYYGARSAAAGRSALDGSGESSGNLEPGDIEQDMNSFADELFESTYGNTSWESPQDRADAYEQVLTSVETAIRSGQPDWRRRASILVNDTRKNKPKVKSGVRGVR